MTWAKMPFFFFTRQHTFDNDANVTQPGKPPQCQDVHRAPVSFAK
jgi:hypothetical protein